MLSSAMTVKVGSMMNKQDVVTTTAAAYLKTAQTSYSHGTFRHGPMNHVSIVGAANEESGGYMRDMIDMLEG